MPWQSRWRPVLFLSVAGPLGEYILAVVTFFSLDSCETLRSCTQNPVFLTTHLSLYLPSPALEAMSLPILTCSFCMRKVGLWNFHQMEGTVTEDETFYSSPSPTPTPTHAPGQVLGAAVAQEGPGDQSVASPTPTSTPTTVTVTTPRRMGLRSQDTTRSDQVRDDCKMFAIL